MLWKQSAGDSPMLAISVSSNGQYVAFIDQQFGEYIPGQASNGNRTLHFLNREGTRIWSHTAPLFTGPLSVSAKGSFVCVGYGYGIALFDKMGMLVWNVTSPQSGYRNTIAISAEEDGRCQAITETLDEAAGRLIGHSFLQFNATGRLLSNSSLVGPFDYVRTAWVTNTGQYVVLSSGWSGSYAVLLFDRDGRLLWSHYPGGGSIDTVFAAKNASYVAGGTGENEVFLYNGKGELMWFHKQKSPILKVTISPDEKTVIAGSRDGYLYYYSLDGQLLRKSQFAESYGTYPLSLSEDGQYVAAGLYENDVGLYTTSGTEVWSQQSGGPTGFGEELWIPSISYNAEQTAWFRHNDIELVNKKGDLVWQRSVEEAIDGLLISSTGNYLLVRLGAGNQYESPCDPYYPNLSGGIVSLFDKQGDKLWSYDTKSHAYSVSISNDGEYVAIGSDKLNLLNRNGEVKWSYRANGCFRALSQFSARGEFAAGAGSISSGFNRLYFFNKNGETLWSHDLFVRSVSLSADGNHITVGSYQGVYLFDRSGRQLWNYTLNSVLVEGISSTLDGKYVAAVGMNTTYYPNSGYYPLTGQEALYFFDEQGHFLWKKDGVGLPFSFSPDQGYALVSTGVFDKQGNQLWRPPARAYSYPVISSDGGYIALASTEYKLFFTLMQSEASTSTFHTSIRSGPANIPTLFWRNSLLIGVVIFASLASLAIFLLRKLGKPMRFS